MVIFPNLIFWSWEESYCQYCSKFLILNPEWIGAKNAHKGIHFFKSKISPTSDKKTRKRSDSASSTLLAAPYQACMSIIDTAPGNTETEKETPLLRKNRGVAILTNVELSAPQLFIEEPPTSSIFLTKTIANFEPDALQSQKRKAFPAHSSEVQSHELPFSPI